MSTQDNPDRHRQAQPRRYTPPRHARETLSFWQRIVAFFTGKIPDSGYARSNDWRREPQADSRHSRREGAQWEILEVTSPKLFVGNLSFEVVEGDLLELFNGVGKVQHAVIASHKETQASKGFAFVTMLTTDEARRAVSELHDKEFMGRKLVVSGAKPSVPRGAR